MGIGACFFQPNIRLCCTFSPFRSLLPAFFPSAIFYRIGQFFQFAPKVIFAIAGWQFDERKSFYGIAGRRFDERKSFYGIAGWRFDERKSFYGIAGWQFDERKSFCTIAARRQQKA